MPPQDVRVVLVYPGDVVEEPDLFTKEIEQVNHTAKKLGVTYVGADWKKVSPGYHPGGAQGRIEDELEIEECDILVAVFSRTPGTVGSDGQFRTEREVRTAITRRKLDGKRPEIIVYFDVEAHSPLSAEETRKVLQVLTLKESFRAEGVLTQDYDGAEGFRYLLHRDLIDYAVTGQQSGEALSCEANADVLLVRGEGYTELIGDITLDVSHGAGQGGSEEVSISLLINSGITNRIVAGGFLDVTLVSNNDRGARARAKTVGSNTIEFEPISLNPEKVERLVITGLRFDAVFLGVASTFTRNEAKGTLTVVRTDSKRAVTRSLTLAYVERGLSCGVTGYRAGWTEGGYSFIAFTETFWEMFPGAFKNHLEERGGRGTALAVQCSSLPEGTRMFITSRDIPSETTGTSRDIIATAIAVRVDAIANSLGAADLVKSPVWPDGLAMTEVGPGQLGAWEVVAAANTDRRQLVFGIVISIPAGVPLSPQVAGSFAPFFSTAAAHAASGSLPIPRFVPGLVPQDIPLKPRHAD